MQAIRDAIALNPFISVLALSKLLQQQGVTHVNGTPINRMYLAKLVKKIERRKLTEQERKKAEHRIIEIRERHRLAVQKLLKIAFFDREKAEPGTEIPTVKDQIKAIEAIHRWDLAILNAEMDAGIFERKLGSVEVNEHHTLEVEQMTPMLAALKNFGIVKKVDVIEEQTIANEPTGTNREASNNNTSVSSAKG